MKTLINKKLSIEIQGESSPKTKDLIRQCLDTTPEGGFSYDDLKNRTRIEEACDKCDGSQIEFEDNDANNLKKIVKEMRWAMRHKDITEFIEQVDKL